MRRVLSLIVLLSAVLLTAGWPAKSSPAADPRLKLAFRNPPRYGWTFVHLQGTPAEIGYQHGYLLAPEIADALKVTIHEQTRDNKKDWQFFRDAAKNMMWPHIEQEYRDEMQGITDGANARGVKLDLWDIVAMNAFLEWSYYVTEYDKQHGVTPPAGPAEHCSAFVATGSYTRDRRVVIAHNNWTTYMDGERWTIIFDILPTNGKRILMDGFPGLIHSGDDFGVTAAGMIITETTISRFHGYDPNGIPEFVRARKAMQYATSIDEFARIMKEGNNGGYANTWLVADLKQNEIGRLELGLKNVTLERTTDGYFVGSNFPINEKLTKDETDFDVHDMGYSGNARHVRWEQLMAKNKGSIDIVAAHQFLTDHFDTFDKKVEPDERTLCGHVDLSPRGYLPWQGPYGIAGAVQNKATDAAMAARMEFTAAAGHACHISFHAEDHLGDHPEFADQKELLHNMNSEPWVTFSTAE